jgi:hypothetical protein
VVPDTERGAAGSPAGSGGSMTPRGSLRTGPPASSLVCGGERTTQTHSHQRVDTNTGEQRLSTGREPQAARQVPQRYKAAVLTWIAVYPTINLVLAAIQSLGLDDLALPLRTLIATLVVVPAVVLGLTPAIARLSRGRFRAHGRPAADPHSPPDPSAPLASPVSARHR